MISRSETVPANLAECWGDCQKKYFGGLAMRVCDPRRTARQRLPRGAALPRPPPDGFPVVLGQLPPEEPLPDRAPLPDDLAPLDEPFDAPPELPRAPPWLLPVPLLIVASVESTERCLPYLMSKVTHGNCAYRITILLLVLVGMLHVGCLRASLVTHLMRWAAMRVEACKATG